MLPTVHVRRQGDIVTVEQRVPARVESIHTSSRDDSSHTSHNGHNEYHTPIYEAGLGSPTSLPLVKERLTVPASTVSEQQVRQAVDRAITAYIPGTAALSVQINRDALIRLLQTVAALGLAGFGLYFFLILFHQSTSTTPPGGPFAGFQKIFIALPGIFVLVAIALAVVCARAAWILRTPKFVAEEQWGRGSAKSVGEGV